MGTKVTPDPSIDNFDIITWAGTQNVTYPTKHPMVTIVKVSTVIGTAHRVHEGGVVIKVFRGFLSKRRAARFVDEKYGK